MTHLNPSQIICRYWATSGTCFFGDQCNFAHSVADRGFSGKQVPKKEKACKDLLLTGYCKDEHNGCEFNHNILGVTKTGSSNTTPAASAILSPIPSPSPVWSPARLGTMQQPPPPSSTPPPIMNSPSSAPPLSPPLSATTPRSSLPISAPAFVPAAVAAAQRAALSAWGGITPGQGPHQGPTSPSQGIITPNQVLKSPTKGQIKPDAPPFVPSSANGQLRANPNAPPFVPASQSILANVNAAPFVPQSTASLPKPKAEGLARRSASSAVRLGAKRLDADPSGAMPSFRLPDGDDPALGMVAMSPPSSFGGYAGEGMGNLSLADKRKTGFNIRVPSGGPDINPSRALPLAQGLTLPQRSMASPRYGVGSPSSAAGGGHPGGVPAAATQVGGATYFFGPGQGPHIHPPGAQVRAGTPGGRRGPKPGLAPIGAKFMNETVREELQSRAVLIQMQLDPENDIADLPEAVGRYHTLYPLESTDKEDEAASSAGLGVESMVFKGISSTDGQAYALRRIDGSQVIPTAELAASANDAVERWSSMAGNPHIVPLREAFVSREVEDSPALFFAHDYFPGAVTLESLHLQEEQRGGLVHHLTASEEQLWSYAVQLSVALRSIHGAGLACRAGLLDPSKVLLVSRGRLRINGIGILDVLNGDPNDDLQTLQKEDLAALGRLILTLACGARHAASLEFMSAHYSKSLVHLTQVLIATSPENTEGGGLQSTTQLASMLGERMFKELDSLASHNDTLMDELSKECENGRLVRILAKLGMVNERPDEDMDPNWAETGDRYLLKLFRDFVFHQSTEEGIPMLDWGHIVECLNKLDAGVPEKLVLMSRDERSMLIVSYRDLRRCLDGAYMELQARASGGKRRSAILGGSPTTLGLSNAMLQRL